MTNAPNKPNHQGEGVGAGRPTLYTEELAAKILDEISSGKSLRSVCKAEGMPHESTVRLWKLEDREGFSTRYARALELQADAIFDEALEIADTQQIVLKTKTFADGKTETTDGDMVERSKLRVETRKWFLARLLPKRYGELSRHEVTGANGGPLEIALADRLKEARERASGRDSVASE